MEVSLFYKDDVLIVLNNYLEMIPYLVQYLLTEVSGYFWWIQPEYYEEIQGMGPAIGMDPKMLLLAQYAYEFSAFCTSVIAYDTNGTIIHNRNLDFAFASTMRNITYEASFMKGGKELYRAVMFAGLNGVMTGHREGFSISLNERKPSWRSNPYDLLLNIVNIFLGFP